MFEIKGADLSGLRLLTCCVDLRLLCGRGFYERLDWRNNHVAQNGLRFFRYLERLRIPIGDGGICWAMILEIVESPQSDGGYLCEGL